MTCYTITDNCCKFDACWKCKEYINCISSFDNLCCLLIFLRRRLFWSLEMFDVQVVRRKNIYFRYWKQSSFSRTICNQHVSVEFCCKFDDSWINCISSFGNLNCLLNINIYQKNIVLIIGNVCCLSCQKKNIHILVSETNLVFREPFAISRCLLSFRNLHPSFFPGNAHQAHLKLTYHLLLMQFMVTFNWISRKPINDLYLSIIDTYNDF